MPYPNFEKRWKRGFGPAGPRLEAKSEYVTESGCQIWMGRLDNKGYGQLWFEGKYRRTSRLSWEIHRGAIPDGMCVLHRCDTPTCINPDHLFLGTNYDNTADKIRKGRAVWFGRKIERVAA